MLENRWVDTFCINLRTPNGCIGHWALGIVRLPHFSPKNLEQLMNYHTIPHKKKPATELIELIDC